MTNPHIGQRVWADGLTGTFTVVRVETERGVADLELTTKTERHIHSRIPFRSLHPVGEDLSQTVAWKIKDR